MLVFDLYRIAAIRAAFCQSVIFGLINDIKNIRPEIINRRDLPKKIKTPISYAWALWPLLLLVGAFTSPAQAAKTVTLIEMGDLHGTLVPHAAVLKHSDGTDRLADSAGGLARLKTVVDGIRAENPGAVLLSAGDLTHGGAEALFTVGDAIWIRSWS